MFGFNEMNLCLVSKCQTSYNELKEEIKKNQRGKVENTNQLKVEKVQGKKKSRISSKEEEKRRKR